MIIIASGRASVSAVKVLFTTLFNFLDSQVYGIYLPFDHSKNIFKPPCKPLHFKFANEASLKLINDKILRLSIFGNENTTSFDFSNLMTFFFYNKISNYCIFFRSTDYASSICHIRSSLCWYPIQLTGYPLAADCQICKPRYFNVSLSSLLISNFISRWSITLAKTQLVLAHKKLPTCEDNIPSSFFPLSQ